MKKTLLILAFFPLISFGATTTVPWLANTATPSIMIPAAINGTNPNLTVQGTGTSTFNGNVNVRGNLQVAGNFFAPVSLVVSGNSDFGGFAINDAGTITGTNFVATSTSASVSNYAGQSGSSGAPTYGFSTQAGTGMFYGGFSDLRFAVATVPRMEVIGAGLSLSTNSLMFATGIGGVQDNFLSRTASGQLTLGTTAGATNGSLALTTIRANAHNTTDNSYTLIQNQSTLTEIFSGDGISLIQIPASDRIGIASTTPWGLLSINPNALGSGVPEFVIGSSTATHLVVDGTGYVGISDSTPSFPLDVTGKIRATSHGIFGNFVYLDGLGSSAYWAYVGGDLLSDKGINIAGSVTSAGATDNTFVGKVGVASTTPWALLSVNPNGISGPAFAIGSSTRTDFVVTNGGNTGIGTASPAEKLHVVGNIKITTAPGNTNAGSISVARTDSTALWDLTSDSSANFGITALNTVTLNSTNGAGIFFNQSGATKMNIIGSNVGIATTSPFATLSLTGNATTIPFAISSTTAVTASSTLFMVDQAGWVHYGGGTPTLSSCGTAPTLDGNSTDQSGSVTFGATASGCTITFSSPAPSKPHCIVSTEAVSLVNAYTVTESATALTITQASSGGVTFDYFCPLGH